MKDNAPKSSNPLEGIKDTIARWFRIPKGVEDIGGVGGEDVY